MAIKLDGYDFSGLIQRLRDPDMTSHDVGSTGVAWSLDDATLLNEAADVIECLRRRLTIAEDSMKFCAEQAKNGGWQAEPVMGSSNPLGWPALPVVTSPGSTSA